LSDFTYTALNREGKKESAVIQAASLVAAGHLLKEQGLLPVQIKEKSKQKDILAFMKNFSSVPLAEKINFIQNLGLMLKSGISGPRALQILVKQTRNAKFQSVLTDIANMVQAGKSLSEALEKYPKVFTNIFVSMVRVGEISGGLDKSLEYLNIQLQREADLKSRVKGAMLYPAVIMFAMVVIGVLMSIFVLPKLTSIFKDFGTQLPITTRIVIAFADFMSAHAVIAIGGMIAIFVGLFSFYKTYIGQKTFDIIILHFYIINTIVKKINLARFARILSSLLKSGIPIVQALEVAGESISSIPYRELIVASANDVKLDKPLTASLGKDKNLFPILVVQMLEVGEESGAIQDILEQLAQHFEEEVDVTLKNLSSIIEPLLLLFIGGIVGVLALALIAPIYNITQTIS